MDDESQRTCQNKISKSLRKSQTNRRRSNTSGKISSQLPHSSEIHSDQLSTDTDNDLLNVIIGDLTSDVDDTRVTSASSILSTTNKNESISPPINENCSSNKHVLLTTKPPRTSKKRGKSNRYEERTHNSSKHLNNSDEKYDLTIRRKSIGDQRRDRLTKHMKDFYQDCFEFDQHSNINYLPDNILNIDKRKEYSTALW
jgi:hypothetical protein